MARAVAKLFKNGGSQAVRLPANCRFAGATEVYVRREGDVVILEPKDSWPAEFFESLRPEDVVERPRQRPLREWKSPLAGRRR
ncbi:MAG: AbrB/MazE/SpoVT family DNA-binding domain-containing protein [Myxococcaceae bacterium]|nr:AbrB/MazE/SpoVT family DNA-binding domain-containing protein [Myxococcaceae bacterium]